MPAEFRVMARGSRHVGVRLPPILRADPLLVERLRRPRALRQPPQVSKLRATRVRLRHIFVVAGAGLLLALFVPRALAYVRLHEAASSLANYALCMVGPTGPSTLLDKPDEFQRLVRRRLMASDPSSRPFEACAALLDGFGAGTKRALHTARAADFREYAGGTARSGAMAIAELGVTAERLWQLAGESWPFGKSSPVPLVQPSRTARAAAHPVPLAVPTLGRGLPDMDVGHGTVRRTSEGYVLVAGREANQVAFVSRDAGQSWTELPSASPLARAVAGRCGAGEASASFQVTSEAEQLRIESWQAGELQTSFPLAPSDAHRVSLSCDAATALALIIAEASAVPRLALCPHSSRCRELSLPAGIASLVVPESELSVARVRGASVLALATGGIVRIVSSRDDGETWTPPVVAYDRDDQHGELRRGSSRLSARVPSRLLALEDRVLLYAGADGGEPYPVLASEDFGASWRAFAGGS